MIEETTTFWMNPVMTVSMKTAERISLEKQQHFSSVKHPLHITYQTSSIVTQYELLVTRENSSTRMFIITLTSF